MAAPLLEADIQMKILVVEDVTKVAQALFQGLSAERFEVTLPAGQAATIGGLLAELAGRIPNAGERFTLQGLEFDVIQASPMRVERLLIRPAPAPAVPLARAAP